MSINKVVLSGLLATVLLGNAHAATTDFSLGVFHINDHYSHVMPNTNATLLFNGQSTTVEMGGFPRIVSKVVERAKKYPNVLKLHAGNAITGDLYYTLFKGGTDATEMNQLCFDALNLGSHEFDYGDAGLKSFLDYLNAYDANSICTTTLSTNVKPKVGTPLAPRKVTDYIKPYLIKQYGDVKVGVIGILDANKTKHSSSPNVTTQFLDGVKTAQRYIYSLQAQGVNKIVLMSSYGYQHDIEIAKQLNGVDVIIGSGSNTLLGSSLSKFGLTPGGAYPTKTKDKSGHPVCIAHAGQYAMAVGELKVVFDINGLVKNCSGTPHILLGNSFKRNGVELTDAARTEVLDIIKTAPELSIVKPDLGSSIWVSYADTFVSMLKQSSIGQVSENLCLTRIPGQNLSKICDVSLTRAHGSDISNIVALAFKNQSKLADISIQNAGGVRVDIAAGDLSIGGAYTLLPFANTLVNLKVTGAELVAVLEDALDYSLSPSGSNGSYPYASGLRWSVDISKPKGQRFSNVEVKLKADSQWSAIDLNRTYVVVTSNFLASGKDGYQTFATVSADAAKVENTGLEYAQSFINYVKAVGTVSKLPISEYSTQSFYDANGLLQN